MKKLNIRTREGDYIGVDYTSFEMFDTYIKFIAKIDDGRTLELIIPLSQILEIQREVA